MIKNFIADLGKDILLCIVDNSYWVCLFVCMVSVMMYVSGLKKAGKFVPVSFVTYTLLQCLKVCLR
ncbi:hypothetical protein [Clostridium sp. HBUAS56017]|uniref:hypothetical protein n=1 Tax=Clostridium sp. HBUAS56017 TaxID=2571128 RepID=UPI001177516E|nr:hypothetical protein [Clostridium sp. HBUAS56017]